MNREAQLTELARTFARAYQKAFDTYNRGMLEAVSSINPNRIGVDEKVYSPSEILFMFSAFQGSRLRAAIEKFAGGDDEPLEDLLEIVKRTGEE